MCPHCRWRRGPARNNQRYKTLEYPTADLKSWATTTNTDISEKLVSFEKKSITQLRVLLLILGLLKKGFKIVKHWQDVWLGWNKIKIWLEKFYFFFFKEFHEMEFKKTVETTTLQFHVHNNAKKLLPELFWQKEHVCTLGWVDFGY